MAAVGDTAGVLVLACTQNLFRVEGDTWQTHADPGAPNATNVYSRAAKSVSVRNAT